MFDKLRDASVDCTARCIWGLGFEVEGLRLGGFGVEMPVSSAWLGVSGVLTVKCLNFKP